MSDRLEGSLDVDDEDDAVDVHLSDKPAPKPSPDGEESEAPESLNLCDYLDADEQKKIGARACKNYDADVEASAKHMRRLNEYDKLYSSALKAKTWPFEHCANVNVPLLMTAVLQVQGRLFDMIMPAKGEIFHSLPSDSQPEELDRANRTELYANTWARHETPEFQHVYDDVLFLMCIHGSAFSSYMWDPDEGRVIPEAISCYDMVVPFRAKSHSPQMKGVPRYTRIRWMTYYEIQDKGDSGFFSNTDKIKKGEPKDTDDDNSETLDDIAGQEEPGGGDDEDQPRKVLEQHIQCLTLPDDQKRHPSFDGKTHPAIVWIDADTEAVLRIVLREEDDPRDKVRFDRETSAMHAAIAAQTAFAQAGGVQGDPTTGELVQMPPPPPMPAEPKPVKKREVTFFTHYRAFPAQGFYGMGFGDMVGPLNAAMNAILNQAIDLGTINNSRGGFVSRQLRFPPGSLSMQPGQFIQIDAPPAAMKDGLQPAPLIQGDPNMIRFAEMMETWGNRSAGSGDTLSGEPIGSNETAQGAVLRTQAAEKQITVLAGRVISYMKNDADMFWRLMSVFLPEDPQDTQVMDKAGQPTTKTISRADFTADSRVFPSADPRVTSKDQRVSDADGALSMAMANPLLANNPQIIHSLTERVLHARDLADLVPLLQPAVPPPPPPIPQEAENAAFLEGQMPQINPADNDDEHLAKIDAFKASPEAQAMTPQISNALDQHARNHVAAKMKKEVQNGNPTAGTPIVPGPNGAGNGPMAGPPGVPTPPPPPPGM